MARALAPRSFPPSTPTTQYSIRDPPLPMRYTLTSLPLVTARVASTISLYWPCTSHSPMSRIDTSASWGVGWPTNFAKVTVPKNNKVSFRVFSLREKEGQEGRGINTKRIVFKTVAMCQSHSLCHFFLNKENGKREAGKSHEPSSGNPASLLANLNDTGSNGSSASLT